MTDTPIKDQSVTSKAANLADQSLAAVQSKTENQIADITTDYSRLPVVLLQVTTQVVLQSIDTKNLEAEELKLLDNLDRLFLIVYEGIYQHKNTAINQLIASTGCGYTRQDVLCVSDQTSMGRMLLKHVKTALEAQTASSAH